MAISAGSPNRTPSSRAWDLTSLAELCILQDRYAEAEETLRVAVSLQKQEPQGHWEPVRQAYAALLKLTGRVGEAIEMELASDPAPGGPRDPVAAARAKVLAPPPAPEEQPEFVWISSLIVGYVREASAEIWWKTTGDAASAVCHHSGGGGGSGRGGAPGQQEHALTLTLQSLGPWVSLQVFAAAGGRADVMSACFIPARAPAPDGQPRIEVESHARLLGKPSFAEAEVRLANRGDGDALRVHLDRLTLATGWELLSQRVGGAPLPEPLDIGRIGAGGSGLLIVRLSRRSGEAPPAIAIHGTYTDSAGTMTGF